MFIISEDLTIHLTRGDAAAFDVGAIWNGEEYTFQPGDVIRFKVYGKKNTTDVVLIKDIEVEEETSSVRIRLDREETKIGDYINKPTDYWYEVELNPEGYAETIIGYDENGAKILKLYPEGGDMNG